MLLKTLLTVTSPMLSLFLLSAGDSFFTTLVSIVLSDLGYSSVSIGIISAFYSIGTLVGAFLATKFILRVLHIRAYAAFAAMLAIASLLQGFLTEFQWWLILRFTCGACIYGMFITMESWLLEVSSSKTRGQILAIYSIALYSAQGLSQQLFNFTNVNTLMPYCIITILVTLSIIPVATTESQVPSAANENSSDFKIKDILKFSMLGVISCVVGGATLRTLYVFLPLTLEKINYPLSELTILLSTLSFGGMLLQYPFGKISDIYDRKNVILGLSASTAIISFLLFFTYGHFGAALVLIFLLGGTSFTLYPLAVSYACDYIENKDIIPATSALLFFYALGSIFGPIISPIFDYLSHGAGIFIFIGLISAILSIYTWQHKPKNIPNAEHEDYVAITHTTPLANELDPRVDSEENISEETDEDTEAIQAISKMSEENDQEAQDDDKLE